MEVGQPGVCGEEPVRPRKSGPPGSALEHQKNIRHWVGPQSNVELEWYGP